MRRLRTSTILFATFCLAQPALADGDAEKPAETPTQTTTSDVTPSPDVSVPAEVSQSTTTEAAPDAGTSPETQSQLPHRLTRDDICQLIQSAATVEGLPFEFFARLIWQESRFDPHAVSSAGALGIAQFMPKTASGRGLADPFEPSSALQESAEFLNELLQRFGNLGLAAAAYNAGPKRVQDWLAKRASLPRETQNYVQIITGHSPETWARSDAPSAEQTDFQCNAIARLVTQRRGSAVLTRLARLVVHRLSGGTGVAARVAARGSSRKGILAKRVAPPPTNSKEHVTTAAAQSRTHVERIIKITAHGHNRPRVQIIKVASQSRERATADNASGDARRSKRLQLAMTAAKDGASKAGERSQKTAAAARKEPPARGRAVRVAGNGHAGAERSCTQAKGARKSCRSA